MAKLKPSVDSLQYSTYFGGNADERASGLAIDGSGDAYLTGFTSSSDFPTKNAAQSSYGGLYDAFVTELNAAGNAIVFSTYLGGGDFDERLGIAVNSTGQIAVAGETSSSNFPTKDAVQGSLAGGQCQDSSGLQPSYVGNEDAWVAKINAQAKPPKPPKTRCTKHASVKNGKCACKKGYVMKKGKCVKKKA